MTQEKIVRNVRAIKSYEISKIEDLTKMAVVLKEHIVKQKLYSNIKGRNYAHVEGWQFAGGMLGLRTLIVSVENLSNGNEIKWRANVELVHKSGEVVGNGVALCSNKEVIKKGFDEYAILSMSQTRAIGKAYRNLLGWVMKFAGYEGTPAEEMVKIGEKAPEPIEINGAPIKEKGFIPPANLIECHSCGDPITKQVQEYSKKIYGKQWCRSCQRNAPQPTKAKK